MNIQPSRSSPEKPNNYRWLAAIVISLVIGVVSCSPQIDLFNSGPPPGLYNLTPAENMSAGQPQVTWALLVEDPTSPGALDTDRIAMRPSPTEIKYLADARWIDRAPRMLRSLLVESFENSGRIQSVTAEAMGLPTDFRLKVELRDFQTEIFDATGRPAIRVRLNVKLIRRAPIALVASTDIERRGVAADTEIQSIIAAFNRVTADALGDTVNWVLEAVDDSGD